MDMREHVARTLCYTAATEQSNRCSTCEAGRCTIWSSFLREADATIEAVRAYAMLTMRRKPRFRDE